MPTVSDADNQSIIAPVLIGDPLSFKAFKAITKNGHSTIAVVPKSLADQASGIVPGSFWKAQFTPYDLSSARLISPLHARPEEWPAPNTTV